MKILFLSHYFYPEGNAPASRTYENCKQWVKNDHEVTVITCAPNVPNGRVYEGYDNSLFRREKLSGISVVRVWTYLAANSGTYKRIANYISFMVMAIIASLFVRKVDIIIATSPQFFCGWAGIIVSKLIRKPLVLEIRDIWPESIKTLGAMENETLLKTLQILELKMYRDSHKIVTVGNGYKQHLIEKNVPEHKVAVITNGVDTEIFHPAKPNKNLIRTLKLENKFICSYVGTIGLASGLETILECAKMLLDENNHRVHFLLVGDGASKIHLENKARSYNLSNITFTGHQLKENIPDLLNVSNACIVHLRKNELFKTVLPSKIFEGAAMGIPIINGVDGDAKDLVTNLDCGIFFEPENSSSLKESIEYLLDNPKHCFEMGVNGRKQVKLNFERTSLSEQYIKLLDNIHKQQKE